MSTTVAFPDFSARRQRRLGRAFACTLHVGEAGPAWVHVAGGLDVTSAPRLVQALRHTDTAPRLIVLDLRKLTSIDDSGVDVIVGASIRARRANRRLVVIRGPLPVDRMLVRSGSLHALEIIDLDQAGPLARAIAQFAGSDDAA